MRARVDAVLRLALQDLPRGFVAALCQALSVPNPAYAARRRRGLGDDGEPRELCFVEQHARELHVPRGAIHLVRELAGCAGRVLACDDARVVPAAQLAIMRPLPLRPYQEAAVTKLAQVTQGVVVIPCGGGKSRVGMGAIARLQTPTLILVHTLDLAEQWRDELRERLDVDAGLIGDVTAREAPVTVAVLQALAYWSPAQLDAFLAQFGLLILDEAHHVAAANFHAIVNRCPARYRLGLTATPAREDGLDLLLDLFLGRRLLTVKHRELVEAGVLMVPEVRTITTDFTYPYDDARDFAPMQAAIAADGPRNQLIVNTVVQEARAGHTCLALSGRIEHCDVLAKAIAAQGVSVGVLTSGVPRAQRTALLARARAGTLSVLVATSLADEGLDVPRLSRVLLTMPSRAQGRTMQRLGRIMRTHPDKRDAVLVDFVDVAIPILQRHHLERRKVYADVLGVPASTFRAAPATGGARA